MLFLPELYMLAVAVFFFFMSFAKLSHVRNQALALFFSIIGIAVSVVSLNQSGDLFFKAYRVDLFSQIFKVLISLGFFLVIFLGRELKDIDERRHAEYFMFLTLSVLGLMLMVSSVELLTIFVAMELSSYSLYILVPLRGGANRIQMEGAIKYVLFGAISTGFMLYGMSYIFGVAHSTYIDVLVERLPDLMVQPMALLGMLLLLCGFFFKLALFPFHFWSPDVYQGAANETTAFVATMPKLAAVALLLRLVAMGGAESTEIIKILVFFSAASMTLGNLVALVQKDIKRMLAYSSIAHAGYVLMGILSVTNRGYAAAVYYIGGYLLMNLACFLVICKVSQKGENLVLEDMEGLHRRAPLLAFTLAVGLFALAGIPPSIGFTGKLLLFTAALDQGHLSLVIIAALNCAISIFFYLNVVRLAYTKDPGDRPAVQLDPSARFLSVAFILAIILTGIIPSQILDIVLAAIKTIL